MSQGYSELCDFAQKGFFRDCKGMGVLKLLSKVVNLSVGSFALD
jgi:hypothetical protein